MWFERVAGQYLVFFFDVGPFLGHARAIEVFNAGVVLHHEFGDLSGGFDAETVVAADFLQADAAIETLGGAILAPVFEAVKAFVLGIIYSSIDKAFAEVVASVFW